MSNLRVTDWGVARKHHAKAASGTAQSLSTSERQDAQGNEPIGAVLSATTQNVTVTFDGTTPTSTVGHNLTTSDPLLPVFGQSNIENLQWIRSTGSNGVLQITLLY